MLARPGRSGRSDARRDDAETVAAPCADNKSGQADVVLCRAARPLSVPWFRDRELCFVSHRPRRAKFKHVRMIWLAADRTFNFRRSQGTKSGSERTPYRPRSAKVRQREASAVILPERSMI